MDNETIIKKLQYVHRIMGMPEQGDKWEPNACTIAINEAIKAIEFKASLHEKYPQISYTDVPGHTRYLQGLDLPIMINSIWSDENNAAPSETAEMHIGKYKDNDVILITPEIISLPNNPEDDNESKDILDNKRDYALLLALLTKYSPESIARVISYKLYNEAKVKIINNLVADIAGLPKTNP